MVHDAALSPRLAGHKSIILLEEPLSQTEIIFAAQESPEGGYEASALGFQVFTQADSLEQLRLWSAMRSRAILRTARSQKSPTSHG